MRSIHRGSADGVLRSHIALQIAMESHHQTVRSLTEVVNRELIRRHVRSGLSGEPVQTSKSRVGQLRSGTPGRRVCSWEVASAIETVLGLDSGELFALKLRHAEPVELAAAS